MSTNGLNISTSGASEFLAPAAASMNIPVTQYSMSIQNSGGTAGSLITLDRPTKAYYAAQQAIIVDFLKEILGEDIEITFLSSSEDSTIKRVSTLNMARGSNATLPLVSETEARVYLCDALNITKEEKPDLEPVTTPDMSGDPGAPSALTRDTGRDNDASITGGEA
jgi:hypothetical protein